MLRSLASAFAGITVISSVACTSSAADEADCAIAGTYSVNGKVESSTCSEFKDANNLTVTVTPIDGSSTTYRVEFQGSTGACSLEDVGTCKGQGKCDIAVTDAVDATNATGTLQYSWTFSKTGFTGLLAASLPPAKSLPGGCTASTNYTATRR